MCPQAAVFCCLLLISIPLSMGDDTFAKVLSGMVSHLAGVNNIEEQLEKIFTHDDSTHIKESEHSVPPISTYANPTVTTTSGDVTGTTNELAHAFYEIPYAEPPIGNLRFQPPVPIQNPEPRNARRNSGLQCHQPESECFIPSDPRCNFIAMDEDCLVLSVFSPLTVGLVPDSTAQPNQPLPVLFYIHGGAFVGGRGTSSALDGSELASATNMVVVTINYRLGALGFLVHKQSGHPGIEGNQGIKDQQLALKWVQDNIENFGGDKNRVSIAGNSAGAQSVMFHTLSAVSKPLYNNAIQQSNPAVFPYPTPEESIEVTNFLLSALRCNETLTERECLMTAEPTAVSLRQFSVMARSFLNRDPMTLIEPYRPVIDGVEFTDQPLHLYRDGKWNSDKDMIVGVATEEVHTIEYILPPALEYNKTIFALVNFYIFGTGTTDKVVQKYEEAYAPGDDENWAKTFSIEMSHFYFICPSRALARYASSTATNAAKTYFYADDHPILEDICVARNESTDDCYYSTHASEVRYLFRSVQNPTSDDLLVENQLSTYWGSFSRTGSPSNNLVKPLGDFTDWPIYTDETDAAADIPKNARNLELYAKYFPRLFEGEELGSGEFLPNSPWENILIKAPNSQVIGDYEEDICDFWDSVGYYMDPIALPETTTKSTASVMTTTSRDVESTTSQAATSFVSGYFSFMLALVLIVLCRNF